MQLTAPLVVEGCKNVEKDAELLPKVAEALQGKNVLLLSAKEENYKAIGAAAGLAYDQKVGAESAVDINLAKQLNVVDDSAGRRSADSVVHERRYRDCRLWLRLCSLYHGPCESGSFGSG